MTTEAQTLLTLEMIQVIASQALLISQDDVRDLLAEIGRTHALMPIVDPTGYRSVVEHAGSHERVVRAFKAFRDEIQAVIDEATERKVRREQTTQHKPD